MFFVVALLFGFLTTTAVLVGLIVCVVAGRLAVARNVSEASNDWRLPRGSHHNLRRSFVRKILDMLQAKSPGPDPERRLPRIAKSLEYRLYYKAESLEVYQDEGTLKPRLRDIVREVSEAAGYHPVASADEQTSRVPTDDGAHDSAHGEPNIDPEHQPLVPSRNVPAATHPVVLEIETAVQFDLENQTPNIVAENNG